MKHIFSCTVIVIAVNLFLTKTGALNLEQYESTALSEILNSPGAMEHEIMDPPTNSLSSIKYQLFTPTNKDDACIVEPTSEEFDRCSFDPSLKTKFLVHGFNTTLKPGNSPELVKDSLLELDDFNVFIVDWTSYSGCPYAMAFTNTVPVGHKIVEMVKFIMNQYGVAPEDIHLICHSLGAHVCGIVGKQIPHLGRITGLDPAGPGYEMKQKLNVDSTTQLHYTDASFVDCIHTSSVLEGGLGLPDPICWADFYPDGGDSQALCHKGKHYVSRNGEKIKIVSLLDVVLCNHEISMQYFRFSVNDCIYLAIQCDSESSYTKKQCQSNPTNNMGMHAQKIPGMEPNTRFYLKATAEEPFCKNGQ